MKIQPENCPPETSLAAAPGVRENLLAMAGAAPPAVGRAIAGLIASIKDGLEAVGRVPALAGGEATICDWDSLLAALTGVRRELDQDIAARVSRGDSAAKDQARLEQRFEVLKHAHENNTLMIEIFYALVDAGQDFQTSVEVIEQSAEILMEEFEADLFVCRLGDACGNWINVATNSRDINRTPMFVLSMEENLPGHPVMGAVAETNWSYVLSNNLQSSERGGESYDCTAFQEGYRSRLAFILRGHDDRPFGLIMLYSRSPGFFSNFCHKFLSDCSRIVSMTVGSRLELGRDALGKAAGGMAHVGNNALSAIYNSLEILVEEIEGGAAAALPEPPPEQDVAALAEYASGLRRRLAALTPRSKIELIKSALDGADVIKGAIANLLEAVENPRIMHYIRGEEVLDLDPR
jgi:hypothetical protein